MLQTPGRRAAAVAVLALALAAMVVGFGAWDAPREQSFGDRLADEDAVQSGDDPARAGGDAAGDGDAARNADADDDRRIATVVRTYWRGVYLYGVSLLAALWVVVRLRRSWQFDRDALGAVPVHAAADAPTASDADADDPPATDATADDPPAPDAATNAPRDTDVEDGRDA